MMQLLNIGFRNFVRNAGRYRVLLVAFVLVVASLVLVLGIMAGLERTVVNKASRFFAGDVVILGYEGNDSIIENPGRVESLVRESPVDVASVSRRTTYYDPTNATLFHAGFFIRQRRFLGVDWQAEREVLAGFDFLAGGVPDAGDTVGVVISSAAASAIEANVGDRIVLSAITDSNRQNTAELIVRGIYRESSFFGFATYLHWRSLNVLLERPEDQVNELGVFLQDPSRDNAGAANAIHASIAEELPVFPIVRNRRSLEAARDAEREEREYGVVTLAAQLAEISDLLLAMTAIAVIIILLFLIITMIGVANTYSMITFERTREIGTLRALGMHSSGVVAVFVAEALVLSIVGLVAGLAVGTGVLAFIGSRIVFAPAAWSDLFLLGGRLQWYLPPAGLIAIAVLTVGAGVLGSVRASVRAGRTRPVDALRQ